MQKLLRFGLLWMGFWLTASGADAQQCTTPFQPVGAAAAAGGCYQLTRQGATFSLGSAWAARTISLANDFDFTFQFNMCGSADGIVFVLQNSGPTARTDTEGTGMNLGYYQSRAGVFARSVAIELDIFRNIGAPMNDPVRPHIALATNGNPASVQQVTELPALSDCADHQLRVSWSAATRRLTAELDGVPHISYAQDIVATIFGGNPTVWFGFTASTGGQSATQTICPLSLTANFAPAPVVVAGAATICPGGSAVLSVPGQPAGTTYEWARGAGLSTTSGESVTVSPTVTTVYSVVVRPPNGCLLLGNVTVSVREPVVVAVSAPRFTSDGVVLAVAGGRPGTTYAWTPAVGLSAAQGATVLAPTPATATTYTVTATSATGCVGQATVVVPPFTLPNIITPNGDRFNETFRPLVSLEPVTLQVFSRWGQQVFEQTDYHDGWNAADLAAGSYFVRLSTASGESWKGWLEVVR